MAGNYPPGADKDPRAPWNEPEEEVEMCSECGAIAEYIQTVWTRTPLDTPIEYNYYYCDECFNQAFEYYLDDVEDYICTREDFMQEENIELL
jgi:hypothetical protein